MDPADDLFTAARRIMDRAYAPYSHFHVGAALRTANGRVFAGANVENAAYPQGWCAETSAITAMVMAGETKICELAVCAAGPQLITPCGGCRQKIREFAGDATPIHLCEPRGIRQTLTLGELLPMSFGPRHLASETIERKSQ